MKTTNWQTKALALFTAAVALWLTAACANGDPTIETEPAPAPTSTFTQAPPQPPTIATLTPQAGCTHETPETRSWLNTTEEEYEEIRSGNIWSAYLVLRRHKELFWRQPNVYDVTIGQTLDEEGRWTKDSAVTIWVTEKVDQNTLPPEDRLPAILRPQGIGEDIQIRIVEAEPPPKVPESNCDYSMCVVNLNEGEENMTNPDPNTRIDPAELAQRQGPSEYRVRKKYEPLFWSQPNVYSTSVGVFTDENGEYTKEGGIIVTVTKRVDQSTLPPEGRIPDCLEGVPVQIREEQPYIITPANVEGR